MFGGFGQLTYVHLWLILKMTTIQVAPIISFTKRWEWEASQILTFTFLKLTNAKREIEKRQLIFCTFA